MDKRTDMVVMRMLARIEPTRECLADEARLMEDAELLERSAVLALQMHMPRGRQPPSAGVAMLADVLREERARRGI